MSCCDKKTTVARTAKHIVQGYAALLWGKKYEFTDGRIRICQRCTDNYWIGRSLWCSICKCFIPAKARVEAEECPKGLWPERKSPQNENISLSAEK